ncbi:MAG: CoA pyrophosphatase [Henriciella sp.]
MTFSTLDDFLDRARVRLDPVDEAGCLPVGGDTDMIAPEKLPLVRPAAVLIPVIPRASGATMLLTRRPDTMASHPGQVAFPGGKVDAGDKSVVAAALREASEEVGVDATHVDLIGCSAPYITGSEFRITPVIGVLPANFIAKPDPYEVADVFEAPLDFIFNKTNHNHGEGVWQGRRRSYVEMPWQGFRIWGVTAGIIRVLYDTLYDIEV